MNELIEIRCDNISNRRLAAYPVTYGVPLRRGALRDADGDLAIRLEDGRLAPVQTRVTERWPDGSVRWLLLDFTLPLAPNAKARAVLVSGAAVAPDTRMQVTQTDDAVTVTTPHLRARIGRRNFSVFESYVVGGRERVEAGSDIVIETPAGKRFYASLAQALSVRVAESGPQRVVVDVAGRHTAEDDSELLDFRVRYTFRPDDPCVRIAYKFVNREPPEMGVHLARIFLEIPTALGKRTVKYVRQMTHGDNWFPRAVEVRENVELQAGSFVSAMAKSVYGDAHAGKIVIRNLDNFRENTASYPYYLRPGNARTDMSGGLRAAYPFLGAVADGGSFLGWFQEMELSHPKGVAAERHLVRFDVWPAWSEPLRLNRGMGKEHDLWLCFRAERESFEALESIYFDHEVVGFGIFACGAPPVVISIDPAEARRCEVLDLHRWLPYDEARYLPIEMKLGSAGAKGGTPGVRGMLNLGDGSIRDCSGNNENDVILHNLRAYYRTAEPGLLYSALLSARHAAHVDFIAHDPDPLRQGTMAAHCPNHSDGATYPSHMWVGGLLASYCITGEKDFEDAALSVGENMIRWQKQRPQIFYCDSREAGWPMLAWVQLWHHTHDARWLEAADEVFRFYRDSVDENGEIQYELPHGLGTFKQSYGEFITWRACFDYYEASGKQEVKDFLVRTLSLKAVYLKTPANVTAGGWGCNDLYPAWAAWTLTGEARFLDDNKPFLRYLMARAGGFPWGGVDMHYYLNALHEKGELDEFCQEG